MKFNAKILIIGVNPYVLLPPAVLKDLFKQAGRDKGPVPVLLLIKNQSFMQNLVKYRGKWRLYLNTPMRKLAGKDVGDSIAIQLRFDSSERITAMHPKLKSALQKNKTAAKTFSSLPPSRKKEIMRYVNSLKTNDAVDRNIRKAMLFLSGKARFVGRDKP